MKKVHIALTTVTGVALLIGISTTVAYAAEIVAEQEFRADQNQSMTTQCTTAYGQSTTCNVSGSQNQTISGKQIVYAQPTAQVLGAQRVHVPVDTALPASALAVILGSGLTGVGAFVAYLKLM